MLKKLLLIFLSIICLSRVLCQSQEGEYNLKAAFVYNFTKYVNWPPIAEEDFTIGIVGESPIYEPLLEIARTKTVNDKKITIKVFNKLEEITFCDILFISKNTTIPIYSILTRIGPGTLTVSEQEGYAKEGTAFNFVLVKDKLRFESNLRALSSARLKASSQLLKLAILRE